MSPGWQWQGRYRGSEPSSQSDWKLITYVCSLGRNYFLPTRLWCLWSRCRRWCTRTWPGIYPRGTARRTGWCCRSTSRVSSQLDMYSAQAECHNINSSNFHRTCYPAPMKIRKVIEFLNFCSSTMYTNMLSNYEDTRESDAFMSCRKQCKSLPGELQNSCK